MSSKAKKVGAKIVEQRIETVTQVLTIMQNEAEKMSWFQRFRLSQRFLWTKNIESFFQIATKNRRKAKHAKGQDNKTEV